MGYKMNLPRTPSFRLDGARALIAGASSGIGLAAAVALAEAGADVFLAARSLGKLEEISDQLNKEGLSAVPLQLDVSDVEKTEAVIIKKVPFDIW
jgi:NADP-dependent 3-hydroxy acid dehydrogenase YdfG